MKKRQARKPGEGTRKQNEVVRDKGGTRSKNLEPGILCLEPFPYIASHEAGF
jgi:hypothetical protein